MGERRCENCDLWSLAGRRKGGWSYTWWVVDQTANLGECRAKSPRSGQSWPLTWRGDWCGDHVARAGQDGPGGR
jgi:hypothetical protein